MNKYILLLLKLTLKSINQTEPFKEDFTRVLRFVITRFIATMIMIIITKFYDNDV